MARIRVLSPIGEAMAATVTVPPIPRDWRGCSIGFLDNTKPNFDRLVVEMGALLRERHGVREVVHRKKANAATPAAPELIAELARSCDLVLAGSGD